MKNKKFLVSVLIGVLFSIYTFVVNDILYRFYRIDGAFGNLFFGLSYLAFVIFLIAFAVVKKSFRNITIPAIIIFVLKAFTELFMQLGIYSIPLADDELFGPFIGLGFILTPVLEMVIWGVILMVCLVVYLVVYLSGFH